MSSIISGLLVYNQFLLKQIRQLLLFIVRNISLKGPKQDIFSPKYCKHTVDRLPFIKQPEKLDYKQLLREYTSQHGKELKPVKSRGDNPVPADITCHCCGAPHTYLYDNTGGRGQLCCKVCGLRFNKDKSDFKIGALVCPYCGRILDKKK